MRTYISCFINGEKHEVRGEQAFLTVADYLRHIKGLTGTKVVCAEGDCGACSVVFARMNGEGFSEYVSFNSCIAKMYLLDRCHIISVEGLGNSVNMHPVQESFVDEHGAQCGYCTPGFICAMASLANDLKQSGQEVTEQKVKNYLTGNLCRCTGYDPIIKAGMKLDFKTTPALSDLYNDGEIVNVLKSIKDNEVEITASNKKVYLPTDYMSALNYKSKHSPRLIAGATDLGVVDNKAKINLDHVLCLNNISEAYEVKKEKDSWFIGAKVSLANCERELADDFSEFSHMLHIFASPQIKNVATLVGNVVNASPIADTTPFLLAADAKIHLASIRGERSLNMRDFYKGGYKELDLAVDELVTKIEIPLSAHQFKLYKVSLRRDLDISAVTFAAKYKLNSNKLEEVDLFYGGVAASVLRVPTMENELKGKSFELTQMKKAASLLPKLMKPFSDHRGSADFRLQVCENLLYRFFDEVSGSREASI